MNKKLKELTPQQYKKYNGQSIMSAFISMGNKATLDDLTQHIARSIQQPEEYVRNEVNNVLDRGLKDGFLLKHEKYYVLAGKDDLQTDFRRRDERNKSKVQLTLSSGADELAEVKERQVLRNELELSLYRMSTEELRKLHNIYVKHV